jgi:three-Cys-motif partner protein
VCRPVRGNRTSLRRREHPRDGVLLSVIRIENVTEPETKVKSFNFVVETTGALGLWRVIQEGIDLTLKTCIVHGLFSEAHVAQLPFAGMHTLEKLKVLENYLSAYQKVLKNTRFETVFFDAFAGTGEIPIESDEGLFQDVEEAEPFIEGSARRALSVKPPFARYIFVERSKKKAELLRKLKTDFSHLSARIHIERADANITVEEFCRVTDWKRARAVMFLDPFGNQVDWNTLVAVAKTQAIDLWYLFPAHLGINRQISASGEFDIHKGASLDKVLGTSKWRDEFVARVTRENLLGEIEQISFKQSTVDSVTRFMIGRMKEIFKGIVLDEWLPLGGGGSHWYSLIFACANPSANATDIAKRVARAVMTRK